jgi:hypothetical protein
VKIEVIARLPPSPIYIWPLYAPAQQVKELVGNNPKEHQCETKISPTYALYWTLEGPEAPR